MVAAADTVAAAETVTAADTATVVARATESTRVMPPVPMTIRVRGQVALTEGESVLLVRRKAGARTSAGIPTGTPGHGPDNPDDDQQDDESDEDARNVHAGHVAPP